MQTLNGAKASKGTARGKAIVFDSELIDTIQRNGHELKLAERGDFILVTRMTDPRYLSLMKQAVGIVTEIGGRTCHAAIVSRELGIPAVINLKDATQILYGKEISIDGSTGEVIIHE